MGRNQPQKALSVIPARRAKTNKEHVVPLSSIALEVLRLQAAWRVGAMVFPEAQRRYGGPLHRFRRRPKKIGLDAGTAHRLAKYLPRLVRRHRPH